MLVDSGHFDFPILDFCLCVDNGVLPILPCVEFTLPSRWNCGNQLLIFAADSHVALELGSSFHLISTSQSSCVFLNWRMSSGPTTLPSSPIVGSGRAVTVSPCTFLGLETWKYEMQHTVAWELQSVCHCPNLHQCPIWPKILGDNFSLGCLTRDSIQQG